jgi:Undecaprenyl-phosphate glucose phosphotransferase
MLKQRRKTFEFLFMVSDLVVVTLAWLLSYWLRFTSDLVDVDKGVPDLLYYVSLVLIILPIWAFVFRKIGLYQPMRSSKARQEIWLLLNANTLALLLLISVTYLLIEKTIPFSRLVFVYFGILAFIFTLTERKVLRAILREVRRRGYNLRYLLIVGAGSVAKDIALRLRSHSEMGIQPVGCLSKDGLPELEQEKFLNVVGRYQDIGTIVRSRDIDQVMIALPLLDNHFLPDILTELRDSTVDVKIVPDLYQFISVGGSIEDFEGLPLISIQESPLDEFNQVIKRAVDILFSLFALIILSPVFLLIAVLIKLTSKGPILYSQERMSVDGSRFYIHKFRTMKVDAEASGPGWTVEGDPRVTWIGGFLRRWSLDELPQFWNVLVGDMSMVGPRPERPVFIEEFRGRIPSYMLRHKVPAGITGWAQINGWRGDTSIDKRIEYDLYYIRNWSILLDFKIMLLTAARVLVSKNAY